jgi:hypothetical protein
MKQKTGRPNKGLQKQILFNVTESEKQLLDTYSDKMKLSRAEIIRNAVNEYIVRHSDSTFTIPMFK